MGLLQAPLIRGWRRASARPAPTVSACRSWMSRLAMAMVFDVVYAPRLVTEAASVAGLHGVGMKIGHQQLRPADASQFLIGSAQSWHMTQHQPAPDNVEAVVGEGQGAQIR